MAWHWFSISLYFSLILLQFTPLQVLYKAQAEINALIADAEAKESHALQEEGRTIWACQCYMLYAIISLLSYPSDPIVVLLHSVGRDIIIKWRQLFWPYALGGGCRTYTQQVERENQVYTLSSMCFLQACIRHVLVWGASTTKTLG